MKKSQPKNINLISDIALLKLELFIEIKNDQSWFQ